MTTVTDPSVRRSALAELYDAGVFEAVDVHTAEALGRLTGDRSPELSLAAALAVRAPRVGHVCLDITRLYQVGLADHAGEPVEVALPDRAAWFDAITASPAVRTPSEATRVTPLVLDTDRLYLDRYWRYEQRLVTRLHELLATPLNDRDPAVLGEALQRLFPRAEDATYRRAAKLAATRALTVLTGGPGTGKTTTLVRILATLWMSTDPAQPPRAVLAAPTGKAAARMAEAVRGSVAGLDAPPDLAEQLEALPALTVHRLLRYRPDAPTRFRHDRDHPLPYDIVVLDEASMASLPLMAKLVDALPACARFIIVGDPDQLVSVDAGAVLSDICGPVMDEPETQPDSNEPDPDHTIKASIVRLTRFHRFGTESGIGAVARAIRRLDAADPDADPGEVLALLRGQGTETDANASYDDISLVAPGSLATAGLTEEVFADVVGSYAVPVRAALAGEDPAHILAQFDRLRVLAPLRQGPQGVIALDRAIALGLAQAVEGFDPNDRFAIGQPVMITRNHPRLELFNGDVGVVIREAGAESVRRVAFPAAGGAVRTFALSRLPEVESVFSLSIHKSQGSQFDRVFVVMPPRSVGLLTRELIYTAVTRAKREVTIVADPQVLGDALVRRIQRASGLTERLWHPWTAP